MAIIGKADFALLSARFMRQDFFDFMPKFNIFMAGNSAPKLARIDDAIIRRHIIIGFNRKAAAHLMGLRAWSCGD